jgi:hypothetical protein
MIVRARVVTPTHLSEEQKHLLKQLGESLGGTGHPDGKGLIGRIKETLGS